MNRSSAGFYPVVRLHRYKPASGERQAFQEWRRRMRTGTGVSIYPWLLRALRSAGIYFPTDPWARSVFEPEKLYVALSGYEGYSEKIDDPDLERAIDAAFLEFSGNGTLVPKDLVSEGHELIKPTKSAGLGWLGSRKGEVLAEGISRASKVVERGVAPRPCIAFMRTQNRDLDHPEGPKRKTRLVWGYPLEMTLLEGIFAKPLIEVFKDHPSYAGGYTAAGLGARLANGETIRYWHNIDFAQYDATIPPFLIRIAFRILSTHFVELDEFHRVAWKRVVSYFIHTPIVMPDGYIYLKSRGIPSGSYFTQLVGSIVNWILIKWGSYKLEEPLYFLTVMGDDSVSFSYERVDWARMERLYSRLGLKFNVQKSELNKVGPVYFLGARWVKGVRTRDPLTVARNLVMPERYKRLSPQEHRMREIAMLSQYPNAFEALARALGIRGDRRDIEVVPIGSYYQDEHLRENPSMIQGTARLFYSLL